MRASIWIMLTLLVLSGCNRSTVSHGVQVSPQLLTSVGPEQRRDKSLAYEHTVSIALERDALPKRMQELQEACSTDKTYGCTLLDVTLETSADAPNGTIRMRLAPAGVAVFTATASKGGSVKQ